ncbi:MAG: hypothetical protein OHK0029_34090 [Armatimonadaceae bacterium]
MAKDKVDLITHPMRSRILALLIGRCLTVQQMAQMAPEIPLPSLYRHVRALAEGGIIEAVDEVRVHGALTRVYGVPKNEAHIVQEEMAGVSDATHLQMHASLLGVLDATFRAYLAREEKDLATDPMHGLVSSLALTRDEYRKFRDEIEAVVEKWRGKPETAERQRILFSHIAIPDRPTPPLEEQEE